MSCDTTFYGWRAIGTILSMSDVSVSPVVWVPIVKLDSVPSPQGKTSEIDVTTNDNTDGFTTFLASLSDSGTASFTGVWDPTDPTHAGLLYRGILTAFLDKKIRSWKIDYPTSPVYNIPFCGFVNSYMVDSKVKDALRLTFGIRVVGAYNVAAGS